MSDDNSRSQADLINFAKEYASTGKNLYTILDITTETSEKDIHRAWRRQNLKYHPDKTRDAFDPSIYELVGRAKDILLDSLARKAYDDALAAQAQRAAEAEAMGRERRRWKDELERAEEEARVKQREAREKEEEREQERMRMAAEAEEWERREKEREKERLMKEREDRRKDIEGLEGQEEELMRRLREKAEKRAAKKKAEEESGVEKKKKKKKSGYLISTDPLLSYEEKVAGVLGKLREAQKRKEAADTLMVG